MGVRISSLSSCGHSPVVWACGGVVLLVALVRRRPRRIGKNKSLPVVLIAQDSTKEQAGKHARVGLTCIQPPPTQIGKPILLSCTVQNDTGHPLPTQRIQLVGDIYWLSTCSVVLPSVGPYSESQPVTLQMSCHSTTDPALVPPLFTVRLDISGVQFTFRWNFWTFTQGLRDYTPSGLPGAIGADKFMLLCLGSAGSGKSSFINSVLTLMHPEHDVVATVSTGGPTEHNTRTLQKYDIEGANFCMYDMWGLDKNSCGQQQMVMPALLDGWLPQNWSMNHQLREHKRMLLAKGSTRSRRRVHGVLFFISVGAVHDDPELKTIRDAFQEVKRLQFEPVVVLSHADHECKDCKRDTLGDYPAINNLKSKVADALGIAQKDIVHLVNYYDTTNRNFEIDRLTYKTLDMVLHNARDFCVTPWRLRSMPAIVNADWDDTNVNLKYD